MSKGVVGKLLRASRLLGIVLLLVLLSRLDREQVLARLSHVQVGWLTVYLLLFPVAYMCRTLRTGALLRVQGFSVGVSRLFRFAVEAGFLGVVTPGRVGELTKVAMLKTEGVPARAGFLALVIERVLDVVVFAVVGAVGVAYFAWRFHEADWLGVAVGIVVVSAAATGGVLVVRRHLLAILAVLGLRVRARLPRVVQEQSWSEFFYSTWRVLVGAGATVTWQSIAIMAANLAQIYTLSRAIGVDATFLDLAFAYSLASLVALAPVSLGGLGTREASYLLLLGPVGVSPDAAVTFSLLDGTLLPLLAVSVMVVPFWGVSLVRNRRDPVIHAIHVGAVDERG